ncbi:S41 family peptidase [Thermomonas sp.]|uniref:S41 family peptidase n=1 Tax=Thermomonas sp. TaxID=1971895 RepID=UPI0035B060DB
MRAKPLSLVIAILLGVAAAPSFAQSPAPAPAAPAATEPAAAPQGEQDPLASDDPDSAKTDAAKVPLDEIRRYVMVYNAIRQAYVDPVDDHALMQSAVRGLLLDLDPHSAYLKKADAEEFDELTSGAYDGVGLELQQLPEGGVRIVAPLDDGPAERAGLRSGDLIIAIDGKPLEAGAGDASAPLRGKAGTKVVVRIVRKGTAQPFDVTLVRDTIRTTSVRSRMLEPGFGYVRLSSFQAATASDFNKAVDALQKDAPLRGLVLDMRSNPGGLLVGAVQIADELLDKGGIVSTKGRALIGDSRFDATPGDRLKGAPVVVLVDAGSASASEVLAGALRDNKRARVVGSRTFGKGSVQTLLPLDNGDSVKITTARYYTPSGHSIQALGIVPDVVLHPEGGDRRPAPISEAELPRHLAGETPMEGDNAGEVLPGQKPIDAALMELKRLAGVAAAPAMAIPKAQ